MAPLNEGYGLPTQRHQHPPILIFDAGSLTPQEHQALITDLAQLRPETLPAKGMVHQGHLTQKLNSCRLFVNVGRSHTYYRAVCDAELQYEAQALLHSSASAERETRTKGLPPSALQKASGKNPWMEHQHVKAVTLSAAQRALTQLYEPATTAASSFYFTPQKMEDALQENNISVLRAIISRMAARDHEADISFLLKVAASTVDEVKGDAVRTLAIKCDALARKVFKANSRRKDSIGIWSQRGLACLKAKEKGLMPRREKVPVVAPDS